MARRTELRGFTFTENGGLVYVSGPGIRGPIGIALGPFDTLSVSMFQGFERVPGVSPAAAEDLAAFTAADVAAIKSALTSTTQPPPAESAAQAAQADAPAGPLQQTPQKVNAAGEVVTPPATTAPTNAIPVVTADSAAGTDTGTDPPVKKLSETQSTSGTSESQTGTSSAVPVSGTTASGQVTNGVNQAGENVGFGVFSEDGTRSNLRRNPETGELYDPGGIASPAADVEPGVGAVDNNTPASNTDSQQAVNASSPTKALIKPQPNILDKFANYTYTASVYLMTPAQLSAYQLSEKKSVNGYNLLFQTGGAPNNVGGPQGVAAAETQTLFENDGTSSSTAAVPTATQPDAGRNPFFPYDYYIDTIKITNKPFGKNTMAAHSVTDLKFTVIEPANISLIDNIYLAVQDIAPKTASGAINYAAAVYLMVIRFYGYDLNGKLQQVGAADPNTGLSDANALVEKYIPFRIKNINWGVTGKLVTYEFDCAPIGQLIAGGTKRGTIPADIELTGSTVSAMLKGQAVYGSAPAPATPGTTTTADRTQTDGRGRANAANAANDSRTQANSPPKATAAPNNNKTIQQGLIEAMNAEQQRLVKAGTYTVADQYELIFANGAKAIEDATVAKPGKPSNKSATAVSQPASKNPSAASPDKGAMDTTSRSTGITAGMQLLQAIELVIRNSSYITNQANIIINETTGKPEPKPGNENSDFQWFNILMSATPLDYDDKRNDFAYKITYIVVPYSPAEMKSNYFPDVKFPGIVKRYPYWFTGENTSVLNYQATFNKLYIQTMTGSSPDTSALASIRKTQATSMREIPFIAYQSRSTESAMGADGKTNEIAANAAEYLYNPSDNASAKIKILGDPAFIQQGSVAGTLNPNKISYEPFGRDGTINFDTRDVLFEIVWQRPEDYNLTTGLADPYSRTQSITGDRQPIQSIVYRVKEVVSNFAQGKFEQDIDATIYTLPIPQKTNTATNAQAVQPDDGSYDRAEARRLSGNNTGAGGGRGGQGGPTAAQLSAAQQQKTVSNGAKNNPPPPVNQNDGSYDRAESARLGRTPPTPWKPDQPVVSNGQTVGANTFGGAAVVFRPGRRTDANATSQGTQRGNREY